MQVARAIDRVPKPARVRALYDIPDFNNPLGTSMPVAQRQALLELCRQREVLIFEDNAYGMFAYDHDRLPTLKSLDTAGTVIYIGSFSKTLFPALRLGYLVADQRVAGRDAWLAQELSRVKSLITVNTPSLTQALVAELLQASGYSLASLVHHRVTSCKAQRDAMLAALAAHFDDLRSDVTWNVPSGGFFLTLTVPFAFGPDEVRACAANFGVVVCPMTFFCLDASRRHQVRLAFSYIDPEHIWLGVQRLAAFVRTRSH
jgi:(S)-3,5-dihydroxyphenylglycine transaminase